MVWAVLAICLLITLSFHIGYDITLLRRKHRVGGFFWLFVMGVGITLYALSGAAALLTLGSGASVWWAVAGGGLVGLLDATLGAFAKRLVLKTFREIGEPWTFVTPISWISQGLVGAAMGAMAGGLIRIFV